MLIYPVFIPFAGCPYKCIYCQQESITGVKEKEIKLDLEMINRFIHKHSDSDKEIAFYGGTFTALDNELQNHLLESVYDLLDEHSFIRISTRPDEIDKNKLDLLKEYKVRSIELGIQSFNDQVLMASGRNYTSKTAIDACKLVKDNGFRLSIQLMPGLPEDTPDIFRHSVETSISLQPDYVRLYPTIVIKDTRLHQLWLDQQYRPWNLDDTIELLIECLEKYEEKQIKVIKIGLHTELENEKELIIAGPWHSNIGELIKGIRFFRKILKDYADQETLMLSKFDFSLIVGNNQFVITYFKNQHIRIPENFYVDNQLTRGLYYFIDKK